MLTGQLILLPAEQVFPVRVDCALNPWRRLVGLLGRAFLPSDHALWIAPCDSIHMFGMRFAIDAIFLDTSGRIVRILEEFPPWKAVWPVKGAWSVLEMSSGSVASHSLREGMILGIKLENGHSLALQKGLKE